jgi:hypothetical protein
MPPRRSRRQPLFVTIACWIGCVVQLAVVGYAAVLMKGTAAPLTSCERISTDDLNRALQNSPLNRLIDIRALEVISASDAGSTDHFHLNCKVVAFLSSGGETTLDVSTTLINGHSYVVVQLF